MRVVHEIQPFFDENSKMLILGSFPSVKSREEGFFYGNEKNRFWKVLAAVFEEKEPKSVEQKKAFLRKNKIAVYDVIKECEIVGSSDSKIKNEVPSELDEIIKRSKIKKIFLNGKKATELFEKYFDLEIPHVSLPSTSPANAAYSLEKLIKSWEIILGDII